MKTHILFSIPFFRKSHRLWDNVEKYSWDREATNDVTWRIRVACWISKAICTYPHAQAHAPKYPHAHTNAQAWTHRRICNTYCFSTATMVSRPPVLFHITCSKLTDYTTSGCNLSVGSLWRTENCWENSWPILLCLSYDIVRSRGYKRFGEMCVCVFFFREWMSRDWELARCREKTRVERRLRQNIEPNRSRNVEKRKLRTRSCLSNCDKTFN